MRSHHLEVLFNSLAPVSDVPETHMRRGVLIVVVLRFCRRSVWSLSSTQDATDHAVMKSFEIRVISDSRVIEIVCAAVDAITQSVSSAVGYFGYFCVIFGRFIVVYRCCGLPF